MVIEKRSLGVRFSDALKVLKGQRLVDEEQGKEEAVGQGLEDKDEQRDSIETEKMAPEKKKEYLIQEKEKKELEAIDFGNKMLEEFSQLDEKLKNLLNSQDIELSNYETSPSAEIIVKLKETAKEIEKIHERKRGAMNEWYAHLGKVITMMKELAIISVNESTKGKNPSAKEIDEAINKHINSIVNPDLDNFVMKKVNIKYIKAYLHTTIEEDGSYTRKMYNGLGNAENEFVVNLKNNK